MATQQSLESLNKYIPRGNTQRLSFKPKVPKVAKQAMANVFKFGRVHQRTLDSLHLNQHGNMAESSEVQQQLQIA